MKYVVFVYIPDTAKATFGLRLRDHSDTIYKGIRRP